MDNRQKHKDRSHKTNGKINAGINYMYNRSYAKTSKKRKLNELKQQLAENNG